MVGVLVIFFCLDGLKLGVVIDEIVYYKDYIDMIVDKWFFEVVFIIVEFRVDFFGV